MLRQWRQRSEARRVRSAEPAGHDPLPGMDGGGEWGGVAFDPNSGLLYVNANEMAWRVKLAERKAARRQAHDAARRSTCSYCAACHRADLSGNPPEFPSLVGIGARATWTRSRRSVRQGGGRMPAYGEMHSAIRRAHRAHVLDGTSMTVRSDKPSPFDLKLLARRRGPLQRSRRLPAITPPWGTLTAIDHRTGRHRLAGAARRDARLRASRTRGSENYGGPVVTASGLVFIGATVYDNKFHAFDARTGRLLWETTLPAAGNATPAQYEVARQGIRGHRGGRRAGGAPVRRHARRLRATVST